MTRTPLSFLTRFPILALLVGAMLLAGASPGHAQANFSTGAGPNDVATASQTIDFEEWEALARDTEALIELPGVSEIRLEQRRAELVTWRELFLSAQDANSSRIATLRGQRNSCHQQLQLQARRERQVR